MFTQYLTRVLTVSLALCLFIAAGCLDNALTFQIRFTSLNGLEQGNRVLFQGNHIGEVVKVNYTDKGDYLVTVTILPDFTNATTQHSSFYIGPDSATPPAKAVFVEQTQAGGTIIPKGAIISGTQKTGYFDDLIKEFREKAGSAETELRSTLQELEEYFSQHSEEFNQSLNETLEQLSQQFEIFRDELQNVPNREEVKELEKNIQEFVEEFNNAQKEVQDKLRNEVIPQLKMELEKLREQLKREGREEELEQIDEEINGVMMI